MNDGLVVAVRARSDWHSRIVAALSSNRRVRHVICVGRSVPKTWSDLVSRESDPAGADVVVDPEPSDPGVHVWLGPGGSGVTHATTEGLAKALSERVVSSDPVWTVPGDPLSTGRVDVLPSPVGRVHSVGGRAPVTGDFGGAAAVGEAGSLVIVDDRRFLDAVCAAAGALVAVPEPATAIPVWERAEAYIAACEELGLVLAGL